MMLYKHFIANLRWFAKRIPKRITFERAAQFPNPSRPMSIEVLHDGQWYEAVWDTDGTIWCRLDYLSRQPFRVRCVAGEWVYNYAKWGAPDTRRVLKLLKQYSKYKIGNVYGAAPAN